VVTDENQGLIAVVDLRSLTARRFIGVPRGPQYAAAENGFALVTSPTAGTVTLLGGEPLRVTRIVRGFQTPRVAAIAPDGRHAYVTDDAAGTLSVIRLADGQVARTIEVGAGAHHFAVSPDGRHLWIALGESARRIVIVDTSDVERPRVTGGFDPGFPVHDLAFSPDLPRVWISSAAGPEVAVVSASDHRGLFRVAVGPPPQHIAFGGGYAYLTSGYGSVVEQVAIGSGRVLRRARTPYGSFEVDAAAGYVATASLLDGEVAVYTPRLKPLRVIKVGPATRDIAISAP
jgi:DNA-binding beta-propeller fold protein YncE